MKTRAAEKTDAALQELLRPGQSIALLQELHILTREGKLNQDSRRKLKQVYHLFQFIEKLLLELPASDSQYLKPADEAVVEVKVDRYPVGQLPSQGHVARSLPVNAGPEADLDLLITKHGLRDQPAAPKATIKSLEAKDRDNLTALPTLLLQPWSSAEAPILPAVSLESSETGHRLWVHAPAVAERFSFASALDLHLREQAEALCLGSSWLPLLPKFVLLLVEPHWQLLP